MPINKDLISQLLDASIDGDHASVLALLQGGLDVNSASADGHTALILAAQNGHVELVKTLLDHGASIHSMHDFGRTALMQAMVFSEDEVVDILVDAGAGFQLVMYEAWTEKLKVQASLESPHATDLMRAAYGGNQDAVANALLQTPTSVDAVNGGWNAMMYALSKGKLDVANSLVTDNTAIHDGQLMLAAHYGVDKVITGLLAEHAQILDLNPVGPVWTPVMLAAAQGNEDSDAAEILLEAAIVQLIGVSDVAM